MWHHPLCSMSQQQLNPNKLESWQCPAWWPPFGWVRTRVLFFATKVHRIKFGCAGVSIVCNAVFQLTMSCCFPEIFAIKSRSCAKSHHAKILTFLGRQISHKGPPRFLTEFYKSGLPSNLWQSLVTIDQATSEIRRQKKKKERRPKLQWQIRMASGQHSWRATITRI